MPFSTNFSITLQTEILSMEISDFSKPIIIFKSFYSVLMFSMAMDVCYQNFSVMFYHLCSPILILSMSSAGFGFDKFGEKVH